MMITLGELVGLRKPCSSGKHAHKSEGAAQAQIRSWLRNPRAEGADRLRAYECRECGKWHVGRARPRIMPTS